MSTQRHKLVNVDAGFTLIELMVVVAIIAILASIGYPSYREYVLKAHRAQAKADLVELAQLAERSHTANNTYASFSLTSSQQNSPNGSGGTAKYSIALSNAGQSTFTLTASPQGGQANDKCGTLTLTQAGVKGSTGSVAECW